MGSEFTGKNKKNARGRKKMMEEEEVGGWRRKRRERCGGESEWRGGGGWQALHEGNIPRMQKAKGAAAHLRARRQTSCK